MTDSVSWTQCLKPMNPGLKCLRQKDHHDFKASMGYIERQRLVWTGVQYQETKTNQPTN